MKALELDNSLAEAHTALGFVLFYWDWDWAAAERELLQELDPTKVVGVYACLGKNSLALDWLEKAYDQRDPNMVFMIGASVRRCTSSNPSRPSRDNQCGCEVR